MEGNDYNGCGGRGCGSEGAQKESVATVLKTYSEGETRRMNLRKVAEDIARFEGEYPGRDILFNGNNNSIEVLPRKSKPPEMVTAYSVNGWSQEQIQNEIKTLLEDTDKVQEVVYNEQKQTIEVSLKEQKPLPSKCAKMLEQ